MAGGRKSSQGRLRILGKKVPVPEEEFPDLWEVGGHSQVPGGGLRPEGKTTVIPGTQSTSTERGEALGGTGHLPERW